MAFTTYKEAAEAYRRYLNDTPQLNTLDREIESTDDELEDYIKDALNDINLNYQPKTMFSITDIVVEPGVDEGRVPWSLIKLGATLQLLTTKGIISARNAITYSDQGGVQVSEMDKWGRYINYFNVLSNKYEKGIQILKVRENINAVFGGGVNSPMGYDYYYG